jgi:hypothetical protein
MFIVKQSYKTTEGRFTEPRRVPLAVEVLRYGDKSPTMRMGVARNCRPQLNSDVVETTTPFGFHIRGVGYNEVTEELA